MPAKTRAFIDALTAHLERAYEDCMHGIFSARAAPGTARRAGAAKTKTGTRRPKPA
jgi:hypothetical protein